jgi:hypothetical protein
MLASRGVVDEGLSLSGNALAAGQVEKITPVYATRRWFGISPALR